MNLQQIFDTGVTQIRKQGELSFYKQGDEVVCQYRNPNGSMCALGPSIPNDKFDPLFDEGIIPMICDDRRNPGDLYERLATILGARTEHDADLLREFQRCHDGAADRDEGVEGFLRRAAEFAKEHNLNTDVLA
jgi:hypothetical protein